MNIQQQDLPEALAKPLPPVCVVMGDEEVVVQDCLAQIRQRAAAEEFPPREFTLVDSATDWDGLSAHLSSGSLFASRHFIELMVPSSAPASGRQKLNQGIDLVLEAVAEEDLLLISLPGPGRGSRPAWLQRAGKQGWIVEAGRLRGKGEQQWIRRQLQNRNLELDSDQLRLLQESTEGNLLAARMEMDRLALLAATDDSSQVQVGDLGRFDVFQLADASLRGQVERALRVLQQVREADSGSGPLVFSVLGRYLLIACRLLWKQQRGSAWPGRWKRKNSGAAISKP